MSINTDKAVFTIRIAAELSGLHQQTIRIYEQRGLISPSRSAGGTRLYSLNDIERLNKIAELSSAGVGLEGILLVMDLEERNAVLEETIIALNRENEQLRSCLMLVTGMQIPLPKLLPPRN